MKPIRIVSVVCLIFLGGSLSPHLVAAAKKRTAGQTRPSTESVKAATRAAAIPPIIEPGAKVVLYGERDVVKIKTKLRYTSLIVLPKNEQILDFTCGDQSFWIVNGSQNFAYIKPAKPAAETNLNLVTASGNVYSFVLVEISETADAIPDLKVFVELKEEPMLSAANGRPRFIPAQVADDYRKQVEMAKEETRQVKKATQDAIDSEVNQFITNVRFPYRFEAGKKPFNLRTMFHDEKFTYIRARPEETPALYEVRDGKPNVVNFDYRNGLYVIEKVLDRGYLVIGKQKLAFRREE